MNAFMIICGSGMEQVPVPNVQFGMYMLALQWPPAACNGAGRRFNCPKPYPPDFTIHGLWPQLPSGNPVPPYGDDHSCTDIPTPVPGRDMLGLVFPSTQSKLRTNWPSLTDSDGKDANEQFWRTEWEKHGMCSDWGDEPNGYFTAGLEMQRNFMSLISTLQEAGIKADAGKMYKVGDISNALRGRYGGKGRAFPEIACNKDTNGVKQLLEIRFCYKRKGKGQQPKALVSCRNMFSNQCSQQSDEIKFPPQPA